MKFGMEILTLTSLALITTSCSQAQSRLESMESISTGIINREAEASLKMLLPLSIVLATYSYERRKLFCCGREFPFTVVSKTKGENLIPKGGSVEMYSFGDRIPTYLLNTNRTQYHHNAKPRKSS